MCWSSVFAMLQRHSCRQCKTYFRVLADLYDIIVIGKTFNDRLREVFERLLTRNLKLKLSKCSIFMERIKFLSWEVGPGGLTIPHIEALMDHKPPGNVREVESNFRFINYHCHHQKRLAEIAASLYELTFAPAGGESRYGGSLWDCIF